MAKSASERISGAGLAAVSFPAPDTPIPDTAFHSPAFQPPAAEASAARPETHSVLAIAAWHSLAWLFIANLTGVWLAILLLYPAAGRWLGEWSYGRWTPVHLNFQLYGWMALPLVAWAIRIYRADRAPIAAWSRTALILWSLALTIGAVSWLNGNSSGKLFLDWTGYSRVLFPLVILFLWMVLVAGYKRAWHELGNRPPLIRVAKLLGLAALLLVPLVIYLASDPATYPAINPDTGGPTAASQLESTLVIVLILLLLPYGLTHRNASGRKWIVAAWFVFAIEAMLCFGLGRSAVSHHLPMQFISLGSLLIWVPLVPVYFGAFAWPASTRLWRIAVLGYWALLVPTGWAFFLPGILDRLKFTDSLVGHSILAMAGFGSSLLILILAVLLDEGGHIFNARWPFFAWHVGTLGYVILFFFTGWKEGGDPAFTIVPGPARNLIYAVRLALGIAMTAASAYWLVRITQCIRSRRLRFKPAVIVALACAFGGPPAMNTPPRRWLTLYQYIAGLCDAGTGLLLIVAPESTLRLMGLAIVPEPIVLVRYIGVFVLSVGLTYLWAAAFWPLTSHAHIGWSAQWKITALVRTLVAIFIVWQIASSSLESRWISVALSDGAFAAIQWIGLRKGWLEHAG